MATFWLALRVGQVVGADERRGAWAHAERPEDLARVRDGLGALRRGDGFRFHARIDDQRDLLGRVVDGRTRVRENEPVQVTVAPRRVGVPLEVGRSRRIRDICGSGKPKWQRWFDTRTIINGLYQDPTCRHYCEVARKRVKFFAPTDFLAVCESRFQDYSYTSDFFLSGAKNFPARFARLCFRGVFKWFLVKKRVRNFSARFVRRYFFPRRPNNKMCKLHFSG